ncbi:MAG TPA: long-chain fatty acid--CoA ligase [Syntrophales bacterium]|nr:long-chain fatty acid--CoA ligase [Syntrophales bacterium]HOX94087.1 long-chain fatty acid--CoA ligase [Syntrophales bacterium]HPI58013.1 long-chain fatty acid--CoA ligase [Syntrophales bacterium]HPN25859.1 long-chain fatty acid--CoA ligase [Syntrophales bacterium]HQM29585.1 long-chain fatty acid--CoA ligase [Syntrophales bacterium]
MSPENFVQVLLRNFAEYADAPAMMFRKQGSYRTITYRDLEAIALRVASNLIRSDLRPRDRIAILSRNRPDWAYADLGSLLAGAVTSAIYATSLPEEAAFILRDLEASILFVEDPSQLGKILAIRDRIPSVVKVFVFEETFENPDDTWIQPFSALLRDDEPLTEIRARMAGIVDAIGGDDIMCIIYTSGTTANPKGVVLTHNNYLQTAVILVEGMGRDVVSRLHRNISFLPLAHAFERFAGYYLLLYLGRCIGYAESLEALAQNLREIRPQFMVAVPRVFEKIHARMTQNVRTSPLTKKMIFHWAMKVGKETSRYRTAHRPLPPGLRLRHKLAERIVFKKVKEAFGGELEFCVSGGAPLSREIAEFFHAMDILILEGWGATEATTPSTINNPREYRFGTVGKSLPRVHVRAAEDGELEVKGPNVFKEYWKNPAETAATFTPDGYYRTGDIGVIDDQGWVTITDRKKQLIITSGGKNIAPAPVEHLLIGGRHIESAYVHGDRRHYLTALLVLDRNAVEATAKYLGFPDLSWEETIRHPAILEKVQKEVDRANEQLPRYMQVKYFRILPSPFTIESGELTPTMKLKRGVVAARYKDLLDGMYDE